MSSRRIRDYAKEDARRNELAREKGFSGRGALRGALSRGEAVATPRERERYERAGFGSESAYRAARAEAREWSKAHSRVDVSAYKGAGWHRSPERFGKYYRGFVRNFDNPTRAEWCARMDALEEYLLEEEGYDAEDFDGGYGDHNV